jgi:hypothetical protein
MVKSQPLILKSRDHRLGDLLQAVVGSNLLYFASVMKKAYRRPPVSALQKHQQPVRLDSSCGRSWLSSGFLLL